MNQEIPFYNLRHYAEGLSLADHVKILPDQLYNPRDGTVHIISAVAISFLDEKERIYRNGHRLVQEILGVIIGRPLIRIVFLSSEGQIQTATFNLTKVLMNISRTQRLLPASKAGYPPGSSIYLN